jgi:hypothetical protein
MLRIIEGKVSAAPRLIEDEAFFQELVALSPNEMPSGGLVIEALDDLGRVRWTAYYSSYERLMELARELMPR